MPSVLLTGSSGMIGTRLAEKFLEKKVSFSGADIQPNRWQEAIQKKTYLCDLTKAKAVQKLPAETETIIHLAANARVYDLVVQPGLAFDNITMVFNLLEFCRQHDIKRFLFASSREVYGNQGQLVYSEDQVRLEHSESPYATSKLAAESLVHSYSKCYGIDFAIVRFSNVYGMYDDSNRLIPLTLRKIKSQEPITIFGRHKALDFTYIDDSVQGVLAILDRFQRVKNNTFNISFGKAISIEFVVSELLRLTSAQNPLTLSSSRPGEVQQFQANLQKAHSLLDYSPQVPIEKGLAQTVEWYSRHKVY